MITQTAIQVGNTTLALWRAGQGAPAVIFLAGGLCDHRSWLPQLLTLTVNGQLLALDPRGCGLSPEKGPYDITQQADDIAAVIAANRGGPVVLVSHSLGGYAALLLNRRQPAFVQAHVFIDVPLAPAGANTKGLVDALDAAGSLAPLTRMVESMSALANQEVRELIRAMMLTRSVAVAAGMLSQLEVVTADMAGFLTEAATKPCLAIWPGPKPAGGDPLWLQQHFPTIQQEMLNGVGHFVQLEQPATVNTLLTHFIQRASSQPAPE